MQLYDIFNKTELLKKPVTDNTLSSLELEVYDILPTMPLRRLDKTLDPMLRFLKTEYVTKERWHIDKSDGSESLECLPIDQRDGFLFIWHDKKGKVDSAKKLTYNQFFLMELKRKLSPVLMS